jgi:hypothetical protein
MLRQSVALRVWFRLYTGELISTANGLVNGLREKPITLGLLFFSHVCDLLTAEHRHTYTYKHSEMTRPPDARNLPSYGGLVGSEHDILLRNLEWFDVF